MNIRYFNHRTLRVETPADWDRWLKAYWRIGADDPLWTPPPYSALRWAVRPNPANPYRDRLNVVGVIIEALPSAYRRRQETGNDLLAGAQTIGAAGPLLIETPVAVGLAAIDPQRPGVTAHLGPLLARNDPATLSRLFDALYEGLYRRGARRVLGPTALSPWAAAGLQTSHWSHPTPSHLLSGPPYLPELLAGELGSATPAALWRLPVTTPPTLSNPAITVAPIPPADLIIQHLDLFRTILAATDWPPHTPPPDALEAAFLLVWLHRHSPDTRAWLAHHHGQPVGFALTQPDLGPVLHRTQGGRRPLWQLIHRLIGHPASAGRVLLGGVLPAAQGHGVGHALLNTVLAHAHTHGQQSLVFGPIPIDHPTAHWLAQRGATLAIHSQLYQQDLT